MGFPSILYAAGPLFLFLLARALMFCAVNSLFFCACYICESIMLVIRLVPVQDVPFALIIWYVAKTIDLS